MKKVAKFIRTSTDLQHSSIDNQDSILDKWIKDNSLILYKSYTDEGISGTKKFKRVQWLEMLEDAKQRKFDVLVCKSYSRFGRNQIESLEAIRQLRENKIRVIFLEDNLDSDMDTSRFGLMAWLAEEESKRTSTRIKGVQKHFRDEGKIYNCVAPFGYEYDFKLKTFMINEEEAIIVKRIFSLYIKGNGTNKIANILEGEKVKSKNGGVWRGNTIKNIILNEAYTGTLVQGKSSSIDVTMKKREAVSKEEWIRHYNHHQAIINLEIFLKANTIFKINSEKAKQLSYSVKGIRRASNKSLFSNILVCGCGSSLTIRRKKNREPFYNCSEYERVGLACGHSSNFIQEAFLIEYIKRCLDSLVASNFDNIFIKKEADIKRELEINLESINKKIKENTMLSSELYKDLKLGRLQEHQYILMNEEYATTLSNLLKSKQALENKMSSLEVTNTKDFKKTVRELVKIPIKDWDNAQLKEVIESIEVNVNGTFNVKWSLNK